MRDKLGGKFLSAADSICTGSSTSQDVSTGLILYTSTWLVLASPFFGLSIDDPPSGTSSTQQWAHYCFKTMLGDLNYEAVFQVSKQSQDLPATEGQDLMIYHVIWLLQVQSHSAVLHSIFGFKLQPWDAEYSLVISPHSKDVLSISRLWRSQEELFRPRCADSRLTALKLLKRPFSVVSWSILFRWLDDDQWCIVIGRLRLQESELAVSIVWPKLSSNLTSFDFSLGEYVTTSPGRQTGDSNARKVDCMLRTSKRVSGGPRSKQIH